MPEEVLYSVRGAPQIERFFERRLGRSHFPYARAERLDRFFILGRYFNQMLIELFRIGVKIHRPFSLAVFVELVLKENFDRAVERSDVAPKPVHRASLFRADEPVDAVVEIESAPLPAGALPSRDRVRLIDFYVEPVFRKVCSAHEAGYAGADDENLFHIYILV